MLNRMMPWRRHKNKVRKLENEIKYLYQYLGLNPGERQYPFALEDVRNDHLARYEFACRYIKAGQQVLDAACGVGYGSFILADRTGAHVTGIDISEQAIRSANQFWKHANNHFVQADCTQTGLCKGSMDVAVSFETIEHIEAADELLQELFTLLRPGGVLICSTPNEEKWPFSQSNHKYHIRHYTADEITAMVEQHGFKVREFWSQPSATSKDIIFGRGGLFHLLVAEKPG